MNSSEFKWIGIDMAEHSSALPDQAAQRRLAWDRMAARLVPGARLVALTATLLDAGPALAQARASGGTRGVKSAASASAGNSPTHFTRHDPGPALNFSARLIPRFPQPVRREFRRRAAGAGAMMIDRALVRPRPSLHRDRPKTADGFRRAVERLSDESAAMRIAAAEAKRQRRMRRNQEVRNAEFG